jgi:GalNAc-alpha-(1->4)-GalNAc-alpha-(1->3)-diNAcBac-PP-undecaprenol alpha-1,4-N-acetyl-D-galactosaminyltransferase
MRIVYVIASLKQGGAERVLASVASGLAERGHSVRVVTETGPERDAYCLSNAVERVVAGRPSGTLKRQRALRAAVTGFNPDVVVAFTGTIAVRVLLSLLGASVPVIVSERNNSSWKSLRPVWRFLRRVLYLRKAALLVTPSAGLGNSFSWIPARRRAVIVNPVAPCPPEAASAPADTEGGKSVSAPFVCAMGRLVPQKGFDLLIDAFAEVADNFPDHRLVIMGDGPDRELLARHAAARGIGSRVVLTGSVADPFGYFRPADIFVLSSRFEGLPNALLEAMSCGTPVISFDCPYGPGEIIRHGKNGVLVEPENVPALSAAVRDLLLNPEKAAKLGAEARRTVTAEFDKDRVVAVWEEKMESLLSRSISHKRKNHD